MLWREAAQALKAKGYSHTEAADKFEARFGKRSGLGRSRLSILVTMKCEPCPPEVADYILNELEVRDAPRWAQYERARANAPQEDAEPSGGALDLREVAQEAASSVRDTVRAWLDSAGSTLLALQTFIEGRLDGHSAKLDAHDAKLDSAGNTLDDVNAKLDSNGATLATVKAKLDSNGATLEGVKKTVNHTESVTELIAARMDTSAQQRRKDKLQTLGAIFAMGLLSIGFTCASRPASVAPVPGVAVYVGQGAADAAVKTLPGVMPVGFDLQTFLGAIASGEMGKKAPVEQYMPDRPLPGQKLPPCDSGLKEHEMSGGCWQGTDAKPPCEKLFRRGDACYRPIAADPSKGVGLVPQVPGQEQHPAQP